MQGISSYDQGPEEKVVQDSLDELFDDEELENKLDLKKWPWHEPRNGSVTHSQFIVMNIGSIQDEWDLSWRLRTKKGPATFPNRSKTIFRKSKMNVPFLRKQNIRNKIIDSFFKTILSLLLDHDRIAFSILSPFIYKSNVNYEQFWYCLSLTKILSL